MPSKALKFCSHAGCHELTTERFCETHREEHELIDKAKNAKYEKARGTSTERGYTTQWQKYAKHFLRQPENVMCKLHLKGCTGLAECVDHIDPPDNKDDPRFWDKTNHQAACIHCNSVKGHTKLKGEYDMMKEIERSVKCLEK